MDMDADLGIDNLYSPSHESECESVITPIPPHVLAECFTRIPPYVLANKPEAYDPQTVSLGPLHFGQPQLGKYEKEKKSLPRKRFPYRFRGYFKKLVDSLKDDKEFIRGIRYSIRSTDGEGVSNIENSITDSDLGWMMARDGLFLLQLLREIANRSDCTSDGGVLNTENSFEPMLRPPQVQEDIMKVHNQIPFFVLERILQWEEETYPEMKQIMSKGTERKQKKHLMDEDATIQERTGTELNSILRKAWHSLSPFPDMDGSEDSTLCLHILEFLYKNIVGFSSSTPEYPTQSKGTSKGFRGSLPTASALYEKGVKFAAQKGVLNKIRFDATTCTFHLPTVEFDHRTNVIMTNLLAFELFVRKYKPTPLMSYVVLMDQLINTAEDVEVLKDNGIIHTHLGTDEEVADIWNQMRRGLQKGEYQYEPIDAAIDDAVSFYRSYRIWFAEIRKKYFSKPWQIISLIVAFIIIVLSLLQTIFSWEQLHQ